MKKVILFLAIGLFLGFTTMNVNADNTVPGAYSQNNNANQVMSVGKTQMQIGASDRAHANYTNSRSGAGRSLSNTGNGGGEDFQWGESQQENSWKAATNFEEARVHGMTADDCQGDNSDGTYRAQMNQNRDGYMAEPLVPQAQCHKNHATIK
jgi:hypothetical protein